MAATEKQQVNFADCYVLSGHRSQAFIQAFLDRFLPHRRENTNRYEVPPFADPPEQLFTRADELISYLEEHQEQIHAIYWSNTEGSALRGAMCHFTSDGQVILGLFCETLFPDTSVEKAYFEQLKAFCGSEVGLIEYQTPAAGDTEEFLERVKKYRHDIGLYKDQP